MSQNEQNLAWLKPAVEAACEIKNMAEQVAEFKRIRERMSKIAKEVAANRPPLSEAVKAQMEREINCSCLGAGDSCSLCGRGI